MNLLKEIADKKFILFLCIGVFNTLFGFCIIFFMMFYVKAIPEISNFIGYFVGFFMSYFLNKKFNFKTIGNSKNELIKFGFSTVVAYIANLAVLMCLIKVLNFNVYISQIISGVVYVMIGFLMSKKFVFREAYV